MRFCINKCKTPIVSNLFFFFFNRDQLLWNRCTSSKQILERMVAYGFMKRRPLENINQTPNKSMTNVSVSKGRGWKKQLGAVPSSSTNVCLECGSLGGAHLLRGCEAPPGTWVCPQSSPHPPTSDSYTHVHTHLLTHAVPMTRY